MGERMTWQPNPDRGVKKIRLYHSELSLIRHKNHKIKRRISDNILLKCVVNLAPSAPSITRWS